MKKYDVVIVGAGTGGQTAAYDLVEEGLKVAVVEKSDRPGGVCALAGCQAKKWFYETMEVAARSRHLAGKGIQTAPVVNWASVLAEKNRFTSGVPENTVKGLRSAGIDFIPGDACFIDKETLSVSGKPVRSGYFILAAGARPMPLPIAGSEHLATSDAFLELNALPDRIVFAGGGFISFEFAHFAARFTSSERRIVILEAGERVLGPFDADMAGLLVRASEEEGIEIQTGAAITAIEKGHGGFSVTFGKAGPDVQADLVVHGAGRVPDIEGLNLSAAGVSFSSRGIQVGNDMRTTVSNIYAVGDCAATIQLARVADFEAHIAAENIIADLKQTEKHEIDYTAVPVMLFTYPQYGMVGKTEAALQQEGVPYHKSEASGLKWSTYRRIGMRHAAYKILVDEKKYLLGAHILSDNASGLINTLRLAMLNRIDMGRLHRQSIMSPYPSRESDLTYMLAPLVADNG
ncbi:MAG: NAD(P)/FAD-dependent oxidoreductase [Desulfobacterales bacterium]